MHGTEEWRSVVGYESRYEISSFGRVRGIGPRGKGIKTPYVTSDGYHSYSLYVSHKKAKTVLAHQLVARAFLGPRPVGYFACHNDDDGSNNRLDNIRYDTRLGNAADMVRFGRSLPGVRNSQAILNDRHVRCILAAKGTASYRAIAADFGVSFSTIQKIMSRKGWRHVS